MELKIAGFRFRVRWASRVSFALALLFVPCSLTWMFVRALVCWSRAAHLIPVACRSGFIAPLSVAGVSLAATSYIVLQMAVVDTSANAFSNRIRAGYAVLGGDKRYAHLAIASAIFIVSCVFGSVCHFVFGVPPGVAMGLGIGMAFFCTYLLVKRKSSQKDFTPEDRTERGGSGHTLAGA